MISTADEHLVKDSQELFVFHEGLLVGADHGKVPDGDEKRAQLFEMLALRLFLVVSLDQVQELALLDELAGSEVWVEVRDPEGVVVDHVGVLDEVGENGNIFASLVAGLR